ncbi:uncharacterized protein C8Q71DRAFT_777450 [Rhodofomes roseus]|uniref:BTB domain-containing protein n=1 Tax=Rhodofomes roseus TaxID=34475 RepID=A0ABQ8K6F4_9APHY|nr:uncharacterized protein C8Q71DRAFT_777450 [Rhodofomes roseus]KAH9832641.1 hypothetical protein C8Q71DRAFT_777450 [Rhodofomes roseus]
MAGPASVSSHSATRSSKPVPTLFNRPDADAILYSSDKTHFRVHRQILSVASPFFETMFSLPQSTPSSVGNLPVVPMEEDARTVEDLLRICYPGRDPQLKTCTASEWQHIGGMVRAAQKYDLAAAVEFMEATLTANADSFPLIVYCIACTHDMEVIAKHAARSLLACVKDGHGLNMERWSALETLYVPQLEDISAGCYHRLMQAIRGGKLPDGSRVRLHGATKETNTNSRRTSVCTLDRCPDNGPTEFTLRAADGIDYKVSKKTFLSFRPHAADTSTTLSLSIRSSVLQLLLPLLDASTTTEELHDCKSVAPALRAAAKYKMDKLHAALKKRWLELFAGDPLRSYLIASVYGLEDEAVGSAKLLLFRTMLELRALYVPIMESVSAGSYFRLLRYHKKCADAADGVRKAWLKAFPQGLKVPQTCPQRRCSREYSKRSRWMDICFTRLYAMRDCPRQDVAEDRALLGELCFQAGNCASCAERVSNTNVMKFLAAYSKANKEAISKVGTSMLFK